VIRFSYFSFFSKGRRLGLTAFNPLNCFGRVYPSENHSCWHPKFRKTTPCIR